MNKKYNIMSGVGKCKYVVSYHDGIKTHNDGSPFYDVAIFNNKKKLGAFVSNLEKGGFSFDF